MIELTGNLWEFHSQGHIIGITTNGHVRRDGGCVMGRGIAKQAAKRFPLLEHMVGRVIEQRGLQVEYFPDLSLLIFPVKYHWSRPADLTLIAKSATETIALLDSGAINSTKHIYLPRPGCGNGLLDWPIVRSHIEPILTNRVTIVNLP